MEVWLAKEGIFPIVNDKTGQPLPYLPASGFSFPGTIQGEGKLSGMPSLFIRLAGCNLYCVWKAEYNQVYKCDTPHASISIYGSYITSVEDIVDVIRVNRGALHHLVITGGEPFLQAPAISELCQQLKQVHPFHITVETNATIFDEAVAAHVDLFSLSPKLASSVPPPPHAAQHEKLRRNPGVIQQFISYAQKHGKSFQLKFVYASEQDIPEIKQLLSSLHGWQNEDILLMPIGYTPLELQRTIPQTLEQCIQNGWRYCDRLQISLFGTKEGV